MSDHQSPQRVLVTGATRGLGQAIADRLARAGHVVHGTSTTLAGATFIAERYGTLPIVLDTGDPAGIQASVDALTDQGFTIDWLVNNAGVNEPAPALDVTQDQWDRIQNVNVRGPFLLSTGIARSWVDQGKPGAIVNVASQAGLVAIEDRAAYGASKAALLHLTKNLALEWGRHGIRVNAVAPTFVRTDFTESTLSRPAVALEMLSRIPLGRFGEPDDIAGAVEFLLGDSAKLITGHTLTVDGGYTIH